MQIGGEPSSSVKQLVLAKQYAVREVGRIGHHIGQSVLSDIKPLCQAVPHGLPEPTRWKMTLSDVCSTHAFDAPSITKEQTNARCMVQCNNVPRRCWDEDTTASANLEFRGLRVEILGVLAMNLTTLDRATLHHYHRNAHVNV